MRNARILEASIKTPNPQVTEGYRGQPAGVPAIVESYPGGAKSVTVRSLWAEPDRYVGPDTIDRFGVNQDMTRRFKEFAEVALSREGIREMGPFSSGDRTSFGSRPNSDRGGYPHQPGAGPGNARGFKRRKRSGMPASWYQTSDKEEEEPVRKHSSTDAREHVGISCKLMHGEIDHSFWREYVDSTGGGQISIRSR